MFEDYGERPKNYKKRVKETPPKSKHKHIYDKQVLFHWVRKPNVDHYFSGYLCSICGKRGDVQMFELDENNRWLDDDEVLEKYRDLEIVEYE